MHKCQRCLKSTLLISELDHFLCFLAIPLRLSKQYRLCKVTYSIIIENHLNADWPFSELSSYTIPYERPHYEEKDHRQIDCWGHKVSVPHPCKFHCQQCWTAKVATWLSHLRVWPKLNIFLRLVEILLYHIWRVRVCILLFGHTLFLLLVTLCFTETIRSRRNFEELCSSRECSKIDTRTPSCLCCMYSLG